MMQVDKTFVGYATPWSLSAGQTLAVHVGSERAPADIGPDLRLNYADNIEVALVRLLCGDARPRGTGFAEEPVASNLPTRIQAREQVLFPGSFAELPHLPALERFTFALLVKPTTPHKDATLVSPQEFSLACRKGALALLWAGEGSLAKLQRC